MQGGFVCPGTARLRVLGPAGLAASSQPPWGKLPPSYRRGIVGNSLLDVLGPLCRAHAALLLPRGSPSPLRVFEAGAPAQQGAVCCCLPLMGLLKSRGVFLARKAISGIWAVNLRFLPRARNWILRKRPGLVLNVGCKLCEPLVSLNPVTMAGSSVPWWHQVVPCRPCWS